MSEQANMQVTQILQHWDSNPQASSKLLPLVYDELRAIARQRLKQERAGHTLQATALVHEAYIRMIGSENLSWQNRAHFFGACANAMRQILVDHARKRGAKKRAGNRAAVTLEHAEVADETDADLILAVNEGLEKLRTEDEEAAKIVELRFFGGLTMEEIAQALNTSERTVHREWAFARARLFQLLGDGAPNN